MLKNVIALLLIAVPAAAQAGWVITEKDGTKSYLQDGKILGGGEEERVSFVYDTEKNQVTVIDHTSKIYARGTPTEFCQELVQMRDKMMAQLPPEMRKQAEEQRKAARPKPSVKVEKVGSGGKVAGYATEKYRVLVDGKPYEEVWISTDPALRKAAQRWVVPAQKMALETSSCAAGMTDTENAVHASKAYLGLAAKGWEMKRVKVDGGAQQVREEVVKLEQKDIPASEFEPPAGCHKVRFIEVFMQDR